MRHVRMLLLLSATALTAVAFAAPAAQAEGPFWHVNGEKLETVEGFDAESLLKFRKPVGEQFVEIGTCSISFEGTIENGEEAAEGKIFGFSLLGTCPTNLPGCTVLPWMGGLPWSLAADESGVDLSGFSFTAWFNPPCKEIYGMPSSASWGGVLAGQWDGESGCITYENAGELLLLPTKEPIFTDGEICPEVPGGTLSLE